VTKQAQPPKSDQPGTKPVKVFRLRGVKVAVFENKGEQGSFFKTAVQRIYKDGEEWKTTTNLGRDDLPVARMLMERAWEWILETESERSTHNTEPEETPS
jgi:hypothetical protein